MNKGNSVVSDVDGGVAVESVVYTSSGQHASLSSSTETIASGNLPSNHVPNSSTPTTATTSSISTDCVNSPTTTPTRITFHSSSLPPSSMIVSTLSSLTTTSIANSTKTNLDNVDYRLKYLDKESKSKLRSNISRFMDYSAFMNSPQFTETLKNQLLINGTSSSYLNQNACAAQVRTIMKAAGLMPEKVSNRSKLKTYPLSSFTSNAYANPAPSISLNKMTLMAELFASDEDEADDGEEMYDDNENGDHTDNCTMEHLNHDEDVEYDDDDDEDDDEDEDEEDDDEEEELNGDAGDEGDDEEENSEVESFTLEDESSLDPKFLLSVDSSIENYQPGLFKNDIELHFSDVPETISSTSTNVDVDQFTDSQLYHELQFASSDVHCVLDEVGATIAKMRISDNNQMPYLVHKLQEEVLQASTRRSNFNSADMDMEHVCRNFKPTATNTAQQCHGSSSHYSLQSVNEEDGTNSDDNQDGAVSVGEEIEESVPLQYPLEELQRKDADKLLLYAAASGHFDMVKLLLSTQKININKRGVKEMTPLMEAASGGFLNIVKILIKHGADVNCITLQKNTALMYACAMGHLDIVKELIAHNARIEDQNENGHTSLMEAASAGHVQVARYLVSQGCNINVHSNEYKETALTLAAYKGHLEMVRFLTEAGAGQEHRAEEMHTALMEASMDGHVEVARLLIDSGAQVNMPPDSFESPLTLAACGGHVELALLLLQRGANIEEVNDEGYTALMEAAREGHEEMVALLISHGAQVNATTEESKETALFMACGAGCADVVNLLIKAGADIELGTNTPLMEAAQEGHFEIVKKLLDSNANFDGCNSSGETALTLAAENGHTNVVKLLISVGADVNKCTDGGRTALMKAAQSGHTETVILLITSKANVNCATFNNDSTALSLACAGGHSQIVEILLNSGADLCHRLKDNSTMLIEAARGGYTNIVQMLIDYHIDFYKSSGFVQQMYPENHNGLAQSPMNPNQLSQSIQHHHQSALQSKSPISLPPSKLFKHVLSATTTSASPQPLTSNIKLANNTTMKIYPTQPSSKISSENDNFKFVSGKLVCIPQNKPKSTSSSQTNIKQPTSQQSPSQVIKSTRSLSDSFIHKSLSIDSTDSNDLSLPHTASVGTNTSISLANSLPEQFIRQCETLGKENSDISDQIAASIFFTIFRHFMLPETNQPFLSDEQVLNELIDDISEILESNLLDDTNREWLESRFEMIEEFKKHQFCDKKLNQTIPITKSDSENGQNLNDDFDAIVPGLVLQKLLNNKKTRQKFQIDSSELRSLFSMCASNKNNNSELLLVGKEIQSDNLSKNEILVGFAETICQTDSLNDLIESDNLKKFDSFVDDSVGEPNTDNSVPDHNYPAFVAEHNTKVFKLNPEQIIYGIKNGNIIPIKYLDDALFEVFKKMSLCFISSNKESVFDLLNSIKKLPPKLQTTMLLPLFYVAQSRLQELGFDITMLDQTLTSNLAYQAPKLDGFLDSDATSQSVNDQMSNFFLDETIDNEEQDNELEDDDSNIDMSVFDSFPSGQPYSNSVASLLTSYQNELLASEDQVFELNDNLTVNAATLPPLSSEQLHILKNQFVAAGIFASSAANTTTANDILLNCISMSNANCSISSAAAASSSLPSKAHDSTAACNELHSTTDDGSVNYLPSIRDTFVTELNSSAAAVELMTSVFSSLSAAKDDKFETLKEKINALANPYYRNIIEASFRPENNSADSDNLVEQQPNETGDNLNSSPQHEISFPGDTTCSIGNILSNAASGPQGFVSFPEKFDFNFAPSLFNKDSLQASSNINEDGSNKNKRNLNAKTKNMELLNRLKSFPDIFKSKKAATTPLSAFPNRTPTAVQQATAATVSINTNTTATATTAVCVGTLIPQTNHQIQVTETTSTIAQSQLQSPNSSSKSPSNSLTATTKSITKLKNAVGHQTKIDQVQVQQHSQQPVAQTHPLATPNNAKISMQPSIDVNSQTDSNHESCLTVACANGNEELVKLLLTRGADIELREKKGLTPLMLAATNGHHKIVDILFARGADLEAQTERTKDTALSLACSSGRYEVVEVLLTSGANKEHRNVSDYTPLSLAASGGYVMVIKLLLSYGAEINSRTGSKLGISPLMLAAMNGHTSTVRLLLDRGSDINAYIETNRNTALTLACFQGRTEVVSHLLDRNANIEHRAKTGLTPLMEAASGGFVEVGRVLLDMGADVNAPPVPTSRDTALTIAADKGHESFVKLLIERGALVDVKNKKGYSALWLACNGGHFDVIQHLVAANCDCDAQDNRKISCLMAAFRKGHVKVVRFLVRHVTQFPSDQEIDRCLALCTDDELHKKALQCSDILHQAKERQAAEAFKNAANLLEEIDMERSREENRKAAAARRRERRKQKKKEKAVQKPEDDCTDTNEQPENNTDQDQDTNLENEIKIEDAKQCDTSLKSTKKKKKKSRQSGKKANATAATANEDDNDEDEDTTAFTIDDEDYESFDDELIEVYEDVPIMELIADMVTKADLKKKSKKKSKKSKHSSSAETTKLQQQSPILQLKKQQPESQIPPPNTTQQTTTTNHAEPKVNLTAIASHKKNKTNKVSTITETPIVTSAPDAAKTNKDADSAALIIEKPFKVSSVKSNSSSASVKSYKNSKKQLEELAVSSTKFETKLSDNLTKISDVDSDSLHDEPNLNDNASSISTSSTQSASRIFSSNQQTFRSKTSNKGSSNSSSNLAAGHSNFNNTAGGQIKREEGWKEVVRKSKKVQVPANAISRVIGRGGCNINTIREISGAHIEVEKQKGQGNRMVNIRGSADSTRYAQLLITALSKEAEKDLSEIIRELGLENLQPPSICSGTGAVSAISSISVSVPIDSMSTMTSSSVPFLVESLDTSLAQAATIQQQPSSQSTTTFTNSSSRQSFKSVPNRLSGAKSQTPSSGANTMSNSSASTTSSSVVQPGQQSTRTKNNLKNTATSTAASAAIASSANTIQQSDNNQPSQTASSTLNTVSYTMAVNSKTRSTNTSSSTSSKTNGVKIMSAIYKPSNKSQIHSNNNNNNFGSNNRNYHQQQVQHVTNSANEGSNSDSTFHSTNDNSANNSNSDTNGFANSKSNIAANTNLPSSEAEYSQFNPSYSNIWSKQSNEKPNFASIAASGSTSIQSAQFSNISQKQSVEIIVDENKAPGFNRHFVSPGSFSTSSSSSFNGPLTTLSINTCTNSGPVQSNVLGPIGSARSAPCTPPISNCSSNFSRVNKQYSNQQQTNDLSSSMSMEPVLSISVSKSQMDSYNSNSSEMYSPSLLSQQQSIVTQANSLQSNMFYNTSSPSIVSDDSPTKYHASNNGALNSPNMFNAAFNRPMGFMEMPSASFYGSDQQISKPSIRSNLNPNAPDFASRSNSLSTNSLPQQPSMNHANSANSLINGSNSSIPSTGFGNVPNVVMPNRPYLTGSAPPISNTAVRAAIVNYSMNLFQNQVPKQHQEAAARLAHLSAQNTRCTNVGNEFQNAFIAGNGSQNNNITNNGLNASNANPNVGNLINGNANSLENIRMIQYMYQTLKQQPPSGTNPNCNSFSGQQQPSPASMSNFNAASQFGALNRTIVSSNTPTTYSGPNFVNSSESLSLTSTTTTSTSNLTYSGSGLLNAANPMTDQMIENGAQRVKPAPIGTERAQRKNPMHGFGPSPQPPNPISNHIVGMGAMNNSASLNPNSILADQALPWGLASNSDPILPNSVDGVAFGASLVGSDYGDFIDRNSLPQLNQMDYNMISQRHQMQPQPRFNSLNMMDGSFGPAFANSNQLTNSFKGINNNANNLSDNSLFPPNFSNIITTNIDSDYWSSSASSSSSITKQTPNCSTSGNNPVYETKPQWNNWN